MLFTKKWWNYDGNEDNVVTKDSLIESNEIMMEIMTIL